MVRGRTAILSRLSRRMARRRQLGRSRSSQPTNQQ
jgi:hypothetical protein